MLRIGSLLRLLRVLCVLGACGSSIGYAQNPNTDFVGAFYGRINMAYASLDNGEFSTSAIVNNRSATTLLGYVGTFNAMTELVLNFRVEVDLQSVSSYDITFHNGNQYFRNRFNNDITTQEGDGTLGLRILDISLETTAGIITLGHGPTATDGAMEADSTPSKKVMSSNFFKSFGARNIFFNADSFTSLSHYELAPTLGQVFNNYDGGRYPRLRYDTAKEEMVLSLSYSPSLDCEQVSSGCAASFADSDPSQRGGSKVEAAELAIHAIYPGFASSIGYIARDSAADRFERSDTLTYSIAFYEGGFGMSYAVASQNYENRKTANFQHVKLTFVEGIHSVSLDYALAEDVLWEMDPSDSVRGKHLKGQSIGVMMSQSFKNKAYLYYGYRDFTLKVNNGYSFDAISGFILGALYEF